MMGPGNNEMLLLGQRRIRTEDPAILPSLPHQHTPHCCCLIGRHVEAELMKAFDSGLQVIEAQFLVEQVFEKWVEEKKKALAAETTKACNSQQIHSLSV